MLERGAIQGVLHGENHGRGGAGAGDLLDGDRVADVVHARAAVALGNGDPGQSQGGGLLQDVARVAARLVEFLGDGLHFRLGKLPDVALQQLLLFGEFEIHACSPHPLGAAYCAIVQGNTPPGRPRATGAAIGVNSSSGSDDRGGKPGAGSVLIWAIIYLAHPYGKVRMSMAGVLNDSRQILTHSA